MPTNRKAEIKARLAELKRHLRKADRWLGRCNYYSPRGLAYAEWHRKSIAEDRILRAELAALDMANKSKE